MEQDRLLIISEVEQIVQLGKSTIYRLIKKGKFPKPLKVEGRASKWSYNELMQWIEELKNDSTR